jgi:hypothetical protein
MTPTTKRRIAREWLIFVAVILFGFCLTYGIFYLGRTVNWERYYDSWGMQDWWPRYLVKETPERFPDETNVFQQYAQSLGDYPVTRYYSKRKNPGDMFYDLWPIIETHYADPFSQSHRYHDWNEEAVKLWLCVLSPYLALWFVRSIIWSVNTLRRHQQISP